MVKEIVVFLKSGNVLKEGTLKSIIEKVENEVSQTKSCPQVKIIIR